LTPLRAEVDRGIEHLRVVDPAFAPIIAAAGPCSIGERSVDDATPFSALVTTVVSQQLSTTVARKITERLRAAAGDDLTPNAIAGLGLNELRDAGLSGSKARTLQGLTDAVTNGTVDLVSLAESADDALITAELTTLWGIGPWTVHMFLIFHLHRLDVWPTGDLGVRKGWQVIHGLSAELDPQELQRSAVDLRPYRSLAAWYCWRAWESATSR
jgi:DNA-3-methyladenine glycosylase II